MKAIVISIFTLLMSFQVYAQPTCEANATVTTTPDGKETQTMMAKVPTAVAFDRERTMVATRTAETGGLLLAIEFNADGKTATDVSVYLNKYEDTMFAVRSATPLSISTEGSFKVAHKYEEYVYDQKAETGVLNEYLVEMTCTGNF
jgi:hypothetical protein